MVIDEDEDFLFFFLIIHFRLEIFSLFRIKACFMKKPKNPFVIIAVCKLFFLNKTRTEEEILIPLVDTI